MEQQTTVAPNQPEVIQPNSGTMKYAGFWIRFLAMFIDGIILGIIGRIFFGSQVSTGEFDSSGISAGINYTGWSSLVPLLYVLLFWIFLSATPGKLALGLRIVQEDGSKLTWKKALLRYVGYIISGLVFSLGFIWAGFDKRKQGWHDKIAHTYVVKK